MLVLPATVSDDRGGFSYTLGATLVLSTNRKAANLLSISSLKRQIMFNPKKLGIYNEKVLFG
jgi:hypothetical protein